jgi:alpha-mannosidase
MPLHGTHMQRDASDYFYDIFTVEEIEAVIPENVLELEKAIEKTKKNIAFIEPLFEYLSNDDYYLTYDEIVAEIYAFEHNSIEMTVFEESEYFIFNMGGYYIKTAEGNHRNWLYSQEIDCEYERLEKYLHQLESALVEKNVRIGLEIAQLMIQ